MRLLTLWSARSTLVEATRRDPACEMRFQTLLQWTASISGSLSLLGSGYVLHDLRAKRRANDGVLSVGEQLAAVLSLFRRRPACG